MQQGFVDLRLNGEHSGDESFWPSFTDIMMVIVLIFMLAMVTLLVKNMDLVHQLRTSLAAERAATMQAHSASDINARLNKRLQHLEEEAAMLRMRLIDLGEEHSRSLAQLKNSEQENAQLKASLHSMTSERDAALSEKSVLETSRAELQSTLQQREQELQQRQQELAAQQQQYQLRLAEIASLKESNNTQLDRLSRLESEYATLESKYNKLIRPARSPLGKQVVLVRYHKQNGKLIMEIKSATDDAYVTVSGVELHKRLDELQKKYGKKLYVRIIFPDDSGLSYSEAWNLTESLLRMYDYYYQE
ncbi:hypothetical protein [Mariprofundus ferrooxydans]|uniref:Chromosome partition protein Smc n=1 Tax=Mariprofundus ferrooxydans PV-1 TaxID=314345 RepID=Q0EY94_9PROT|nr:hypothetical protein [Mariprofundus ferrooxydans]EAU54298.1 hypothetical protein SPV1_06039 [Mariprofundus ferrooxydans PV-1]KON47839.1 hypothetical protein AL013_06400 [Mariprofundus ferrooxydans]